MLSDKSREAECAGNALVWRGFVDLEHQAVLIWQQPLQGRGASIRDKIDVVPTYCRDKYPEIR